MQQSPPFFLIKIIAFPVTNGFSLIPYGPSWTKELDQLAMSTNVKHGAVHGLSIELVGGATGSPSARRQSVVDSAIQGATTSTMADAA